MEKGVRFVYTSSSSKYSFFFFFYLFSASLPKSEMKHTKDNEMPGAE